MPDSFWPQLSYSVAQLVKNPPAMRETPIQHLGQEEWLKKAYTTHSSILGLPCGSAGEESAHNAEDLGSIPGLGRSPGEGKGYPHSSILAWRIPRAAQSMGSQRVGHDWETLLHFRLKRNSRNGWKQRGVAGREGVHVEHTGRTRCVPSHSKLRTLRSGLVRDVLSPQSWVLSTDPNSRVADSRVSFHQHKDSLREVSYTPCEETHGGTCIMELWHVWPARHTSKTPHTPWALQGPLTWVTETALRHVPSVRKNLG